MNKTTTWPLARLWLATLTLLALTACEDKSGGGKLLESIADNAGNVLIKFEYDNQNRIAKVLNYHGREETLTLTYSGDNLAGIAKTPVGSMDSQMEFSIEGNKITVSGIVISVDKDGYIAKKALSGVGDNLEADYQYQGGNLAKEMVVKYGDDGKKAGGTTIEYKYDDKKSPFRNCKTPKWFLQHLQNLYPVFDFGHIGLNNNIAERDCPPSPYCAYNSSEYKYDSDGFPTERTMNETYIYSDTESDGATFETKFTYIDGTGK